MLTMMQSFEKGEVLGVSFKFVLQGYSFSAEVDMPTTSTVTAFFCFLYQLLKKEHCSTYRMS